MAYLEFLKANGIEDPHVHELDYHDVLNSQEIYGDDLMLFSNKECEKEVGSAVINSLARLCMLTCVFCVLGQYMYSHKPFLRYGGRDRSVLFVGCNTHKFTQTL